MFERAIRSVRGARVRRHERLRLWDVWIDDLSVDVASPEIYRADRVKAVNSTAPVRSHLALTLGPKARAWIVDTAHTTAYAHRR